MLSCHNDNLRWLPSVPWLPPPKEPAACSGSHFRMGTEDGYRTMRSVPSEHFAPRLRLDQRRFGWEFRVYV